MVCRDYDLAMCFINLHSRSETYAVSGKTGCISSAWQSRAPWAHNPVFIDQKIV